MARAAAVRNPERAAMVVLAVVAAVVKRLVLVKVVMAVAVAADPSK